MCYTQYNRYPKIVLCQLSFIQNGKTISCRHVAGNLLPVILKLMNKGKCFKEFDFKVMPVANLSDNKDAAKEIKALLDDYHKYSIFCRFRKETRKNCCLLLVSFYVLCRSILSFPARWGISFVMYSFRISAFGHISFLLVV